MTVLCSNKVAYISGNAVTLPPAIMERQPSSLELKQIWRWKGPWYWSTTRKKNKIIHPFYSWSMQTHQNSINAANAVTTRIHLSSNCFHFCIFLFLKTFRQTDVQRHGNGKKHVWDILHVACHGNRKSHSLLSPPYCATKGEEPAWQKLSEVCNELGGTVWTRTVPLWKEKITKKKHYAKLGVMQCTKIGAEKECASMSCVHFAPKRFIISSRRSSSFICMSFCWSCGLHDCSPKNINQACKKCTKTHDFRNIHIMQRTNMHEYAKKGNELNQWPSVPGLPGVKNPHSFHDS